MFECPKCKKELEYFIVVAEVEVYYRGEVETKDGGYKDEEDGDRWYLWSKCECPECDYVGERDTFTEAK